MRRTLGFAALYLAATYAGRLTVMDDTNLSLVWPAAGVSAVWFLAQWSSPWRILDVIALSAVTVFVNVATGAPLVLAEWFVVANLAQAWLFVYLFRRWLPHLWGGGGDRPLARLSDLWPLAAAAFLSTACGALIGPTGVWVINGDYSWPATAVWLTRNTVSILLIGATGLRLGHLVRVRLPQLSRADLHAAWSTVSAPRRLEYVAVLVLSAGAYFAVFGVNTSLPLAFTVIAMTVWAGSRLHTAFVVVHDLLFGSVAVLFTLNGYGVFAQIESHAARALVAQVFVGMIAVVGLALALGRDERIALVSDLLTAQQAAIGQAKLMNTIVDSLSEGLTVVDEQGRLLLRNPAVRHLLGGMTSASGEVAQPDYYGLFHPDGSPVHPDEMPHRLALTGREIRGIDILVRNPGVPDGRILSVSSRTLPVDKDGARRAVTVFHDVTAERRHRGELASFAGVVAHDLLNPLSTVEGWTEALADTFAESDHPDAAEARDGLARIDRAAVRMRNLIRDLLAYTTARDATVAFAPINLREIAEDIATGRIDQAESTGKPAPIFAIDELHQVYADAVLLRQLLDNLISNAVKYTAPGVTPALRIHTELADGMVTVIIDDNGIGIPAGQHGRIFDNFHRAHPGAAYTGTGLGLGICKRIVERHGGTIAAADNPSGAGSRFTFTLPADARKAPVAGSDERPPAADAEPRAEATPRPEPAADAGTAAPLPPAAAFEHAALLVLEYLHEQIPLAFWSVTRVENGRQTYLYLDADNGYGLRQGQSHAWEDSFCVHMAAGSAPAVARDAQAVPLYANAGVNSTLEIGTYAGAAITEPDGSLFGAICGLDPRTHTGDLRMAHAEPLLALLGRLLTGALASDRAQNRSTNALLREQLSADTDVLTGLPNRRAWERGIAEWQAHYQRLADPTVIVMIDLDRLKTINDTLGHAAGDTYLQAAAGAARSVIRDTDLIARLGGDEFGLLLAHCDRASADAVTTRLHLELAAAGVTASIGWASVTPEQGFTAALEEADAAMYAAKQQRRTDPSPASAG
ncbi:diguanylate cyclase (GGDEF)-like protein [Actinoplanes lutulentus]|uniref:diguanylate cyclase domain-containing protein n=1 Tax=Actinoplanes lutulentus TaxID=1287878 RepID=UPI0018524AD6|nr:diguanylate cyclase [Actinoplanes lutulentus]MBB2948804.1 diguanylate cyclase (GGDEF)-like protein [Actinoplanes lutulentus]